MSNFTLQSTGAAGNVLPAGLNRDANLNGVNTVTPTASAVNGPSDKKNLPFVQIGGAEMYVANPSASGGVLFFADVDGPVDANGRFIIDYLQKQGFTVLVLHYSFTSPAPPKDSRAEYVEWVDKQHKHIGEMASQWLESVQKTYVHLQYFFVVGCGFGTPFALEACVSQPNIIAGAVMHPDHIETSHILNIDKPVLFSFTNSNNPWDREVRPWVECILAGPGGNPKVKYSIQLFATNLPVVSTGRNPKVENEEYATVETARAMFEWFKRATELITGPQ